MGAWKGNKLDLKQNKQNSSRYNYLVVSFKMFFPTIYENMSGWS